MDPRLADLITTLPISGKKTVALIGFPFDEGCRRNGGRVGSAGGPDAFRKIMKRLCASDSQLQILLSDTIQIVDYGDAGGSTLEEAHSSLKFIVEQALRDLAFPFIVGGSNDQSFPNYEALSAYYNQLTVINVDAHLDVRELKDGKVHSGSPFRMMLESGFKGQFIEFAAQPQQCSMEHVKYLKNHQIVFLDQVTEYGPLDLAKQPNVFMSFDVDSIRQSDCPGVSCSSPEGLSAQWAIKQFRQYGRDNRVKMIDMSEYNPLIEEYRTGRLLAMMFHSFLVGYSQRE